MSLRVRLALVAGAAVAAAVVVASVVVYFVVRGELYGPIDTGLKQAVASIRVPRFPDITAGTAPNEYFLSGPGIGPGEGFPVPYRFVGQNGAKLMLNTGYSVALRPLPVTAAAKAVAAGSGKAYFSDALVGRQHARIYTVQFQPGFAVQIAAPLDAADRALSRIKLWLILVALGGIALASAAGFLVARAALRPVRRLSETAEHVRATRDLSRRIDVTGHDELSRLATTFNAMLASLDEAAQRQRQLVQDASHELRTPLTSLRTNIEVLASDPVMTSEERDQLLTDVVEQLTEMTALVAELTELARGEEHQLALEDVRLDLVTNEAIRRTTRNHPEVPILADLEPTVVVGVPGDARARDHEPARQRGEVEPAGRTRLGRAPRRRADRPGSRPGYRRGRPAARLRPLLPRDVGAQHAGLGARARDREAGRRVARRHRRRRARAGRRGRHGDAVPDPVQRRLGRVAGARSRPSFLLAPGTRNHAAQTCVIDRVFSPGTRPSATCAVRRIAASAFARAAS